MPAVLFLDGLGDVALGAGHHRHGRAVHVGVGEADAVAHPGQGYGKVHRYGGLADAAFAGGYAYDVFDILDLLEIEVEHIAFLFGGSLVHDDGPDFVLHVRELPDEGGAGAAHEVLCQGITTLGESQRHRNLPFGNLDGIYHPEGDDVAVVPCGMAYARQGLLYVLFCHYLMMFISLRRYPAPPNLSRSRST